ncbi:MAG: repair exonuclease, SbcC, partial [Solirubrobacterales bacterium]|nr:repair exonuclease, SbcC [Solirubrobacterales bacterium]
MRLHHLRVQALQAFAGTAEVDFDALSEAGLFLLHGDTGAGKTTLLDAICLALFGRLPGARNTQARPRSDHAAPDIATEVTLELTLRGERVRITRSPEQERPKLRGEGTTVAKAKVLLEAVEADGTLRTLATGHDEAAAELDRLLGMSREQFCQVVLLPQGQFATFLHAKSDDREELLARLFGTERFEQAERWLTERRKKADEAVREAVRQITDTASRVSERLESPVPEGWERDPALLTTWVAEAQVLADADLATAEGVCTTVREQRAQAQATLTAVQGRLALRARHAEAVAELERFGAGAAARAQAAAGLELARAAAGV